MTESEWAASNDPAALLRWLTGTPGSSPEGASGVLAPVRMPSERKLRLFACACRRQMPDLGWDGVSRGWAEMEDRPEDPILANGVGPHTIPPLEYAELFASPRLSPDFRPKPEVAAAILRDIVGDPFKPVTLPPGPAVKCKACKGEGWRYPGSEADDDEYACAGCKRPAGVYGHYSERSKRMECPKEDCPACGGKGTIAAPCPWITPEVLSLARAAYSERHEDGTLDNARLGVLSDALEEAGADGEILANLRSPGRHYRGMWPLDLILGRA